MEGGGALKYLPLGQIHFTIYFFKKSVSVQYFPPNKYVLKHPRFYEAIMKNAAKFLVVRCVGCFVFFGTPISFSCHFFTNKNNNNMRSFVIAFVTIQLYSNDGTKDTKRGKSQVTGFLPLPFKLVVMIESKWW